MAVMKCEARLNCWPENVLSPEISESQWRILSLLSERIRNEWANKERTASWIEPSSMWKRASDATFRAFALSVIHPASIWLFRPRARSATRRPLVRTAICTKHTDETSPYEINSVQRTAKAPNHTAPYRLVDIKWIAFWHLFQLVYTTSIG